LTKRRVWAPTLRSFIATWGGRGVLLAPWGSRVGKAGRGGGLGFYLKSESVYWGNLLGWEGGWALICMVREGGEGGMVTGPNLSNPKARSDEC